MNMENEILACLQDAPIDFPFKIQGPMLLIYHQCPFEPIGVRQFLETKHILKHWFVSKERRAVNDQIYAYFETENEFTVTDPAYWDIGECRPFIKFVKSTPWKVVKHISHNGEYIEKNIDWTDMCTQERMSRLQNVIPKSLLKKIQENPENVDDICKQNDEYLFYYAWHKRRLHSLAHYLKNNNKKIIELPPYLEYWGKRFEFYPASEQRRHYWIWSRKTNTGKTTFARILINEYGASDYDPTSYHQSDITRNTRIIVIDNYGNPLKRASTLLKMCDGSLTYREKFQPAIRVSDPYVFIFAYCPIDELYQTNYSFLVRNFIEVNVD